MTNKKILMLSATILIFASACERKGINITGGCSTPVSKFMADGKVANYAILQSPDLNDSAYTIAYTKVLDGVFQEKHTVTKKYVFGPPASFPTTNTIKQYNLLCGRDIYNSEIAVGIEQKIQAANLYIKSGRKPGDTWTHTINNVKYYMGFTKTDSMFIVPLTPVDTFFADKIYIKSQQNIAIADTLFYNDTLGVLYFKGVDRKYLMVSKNY